MVFKVAFSDIDQTKDGFLRVAKTMTSYLEGCEKIEDVLEKDFNIVWECDDEGVLFCAYHNEFTEDERQHINQLLDEGNWEEVRKAVTEIQSEDRKHESERFFLEGKDLISVEVSSPEDFVEKVSKMGKGFYKIVLI